jgi:hypothetical protein
VKHVYGIVEVHCVGESEGVASMILDQLKHARSFAFPRLGRRRNATLLNEAEGIAEVVDDFFREREQVLLRRADPMQGSFAIGLRIGDQDYTLFGI